MVMKQTKEQCAQMVRNQGWHWFLFQSIGYLKRGVDRPRDEGNIGARAKGHGASAGRGKSTNAHANAART